MNGTNYNIHSTWIVLIKIMNYDLEWHYVLSNILNINYITNQIQLKQK